VLLPAADTLWVQALSLLPVLLRWHIGGAVGKETSPSSCKHVEGGRDYLQHDSA
jgi:hypothetical protein